jgi:hypothetical protein
MRLFLKGTKKILGRYQKNRKGFVLVLTLLLISLLSVLAITSFEMVIATTQITGNHKRYLQALYTADTGIEHTVYVLRRAKLNGNWSGPNVLSALALDTNDEVSGTWEWHNDINQWDTTASFEASHNYTVKVYINGVPGDNQIYIESTGTEAGFSKTIVAGIINSPAVGAVGITYWMEKEM